MHARTLTAALRRSVLLVLLLVTAGAAIGALVAYLATPVYESSARILVSSGVADATEDADEVRSDQRAAAYAVVVTSEAAAEKVLAETGVQLPVDQLAKQVTGEAVDGTSVLEVRVRAENPEQARVLAEGYADALAVLAVETEPAGEPQAPLELTLLDPPTFDEDPVAPDIPLHLAVAAAVGLALGLVVVVVRAARDRSIRDLRDLDPDGSTDRVPVLGVVPLDLGGSGGHLITELDPTHPRAEAFRVLRTHLQVLDDRSSDDGSRGKVVLVASPCPGEGTTSTAVNLALSLARAGIRTLLVDGDLRRPRLAGALGLDESVGLTTVLLGKVRLAEAVQRHGLTDLAVLAGGSPPHNPAELLGSQPMRELLDAMRAAYDVVVVDSAPVLDVADATVLAGRADATLLAVRWGRTTRAQHTEAQERLARVGARTLGVVLTMVPSRHAGGLHAAGVTRPASRR